MTVFAALALQAPAPPPVPEIPGLPDSVVVILIGIFIMIVLVAVGIPIARAIGRRIDRRSLGAEGSDAIDARLARIEQSVDAIAIEVERISEAQRFSTKLLDDHLREMKALRPPESRRD
ncbi:MAG TPA: hypothetical protein VFK13_02325 [Gemmatimonadaceae bacterium]|nr:hypothetical protein [Gemmatimonadaceae bacterium]